MALNSARYLYQALEAWELAALCRFERASHSSDNASATDQEIDQLRRLRLIDTTAPGQRPPFFLTELGKLVIAEHTRCTYIRSMLAPADQMNAKTSQKSSTTGSQVPSSLAS